MSEASSPKRRTMRPALPGDMVKVRYIFPADLVSRTERGLEIRTCKGGVISVPHSISAENGAVVLRESGSKGMAIEVEVSRGMANLLGSLVTEIVRLTDKMSALEKRR